MIRSNLRRLRSEKENREGRKLTYGVIRAETGLAASTLSRLMDFDKVDRIDGKTMNALCVYFGCSICELLEHVPDEGKE